MRRVPDGLTRRLLTLGRGRFAGFAGAALAVFTAALCSRKAHLAGLPEYLTFYPLAVATVSAVWGLRLGLGAACLSLLVIRSTLAAEDTRVFSLEENSIRILSISISTLAAAGLVGLVREQRGQLAKTAGRLARRQDELRGLTVALEAVEAQREEFCREILLAVSHGKLHLCTPGALPVPPRPPVIQANIREPEDITRVRRAAGEIAKSAGLDEERMHDLCVCVGEAATNAVVHGGGGSTAVYTDEESIRIHVVDAGPGINRTLLPRATLLKGYSTITSLGMGFSIMLELSDTLCICTGENGTQILLEMKLEPPSHDPTKFGLLDLQLSDDWECLSSAPEHGSISAGA